ncbi:MAG: hypothetical protein JSS11_15105 [Verrucomicrobia bacterium]|nr:hypothetical protein [Verrucomicrobiota bacterium]
MNTPLHPRLASLFELMDILESSAQEILRDARRNFRPGKSRTKRGATLRPSVDTPLWNALIPLVRARLRRRGDRALLARELSVHPSRITEFFDRPSAMPDAERTLLLLLWLNRTNSPLDQRKRARE